MVCTTSHLQADCYPLNRILCLCSSTRGRVCCRQALVREATPNSSKSGLLAASPSAVTELRRGCATGRAHPFACEVDDLPREGVPLGSVMAASQR